MKYASPRYYMRITAIVTIAIVAIAVHFVHDAYDNDVWEREEILGMEIQSLTKTLENNIYMVYGSMAAAEWGMGGNVENAPHYMSNIAHEFIAQNTNLYSVVILSNPLGESTSYVSKRNPEGAIIDTTIKSGKINREEWTQHQGEKGVIYIGPHVSPSTGETVISFVKPCYNSDNELYCELFFNYSLSIIGQYVDMIVNHPDLDVFVTGSDGTVLYAPEERWYNQKIQELELPYDNPAYMMVDRELDSVGWHIYVFCNWKSFFDEEYNTWQDIIYFFFGLIAIQSLIFLIVHQLKKSREQLIDSMLEQQKVEDEMMDAKRIQMDLLPKAEALSGLPYTMDMQGSLKTARAVGGDLYDYLYRDDKLLFCIGDVSGKGLPAAVYMTAVISVFRVLASRFESPAKIMAVLNDYFASYSAECMFSTMLVGVLDCSTALLTYTNAGHNPPVLIRESRSEFIPLPKGTPVGFFNGSTYAEMQLQLHQGDRLLMYTDGVTEAQNVNEEFFGDNRLLDVCAGLSGKEAIEIIDTISLEVSAFAGTMEQADDITMLCLCSDL